MEALSGPLLVAALLLLLAGGQKLVDPAPAAGALRALGLASNRRLVQVAAAGELVLGAAAIAAPHPAVFAAVGAVYLGFAAFVVAAMRAGTAIASCGCFGREDTPPSAFHVVLNLAFASVAVFAAATATDPLAVLADQPLGGAPMVLMVALVTALAVATYTRLPRTLALVRGGTL